MGVQVNLAKIAAVASKTKARRPVMTLQCITQMERNGIATPSSLLTATAAESQPIDATFFPLQKCRYHQQAFVQQTSIAGGSSFPLVDEKPMNGFGDGVSRSPSPRQQFTITSRSNTSDNSPPKPLDAKTVANMLLLRKQLLLLHQLLDTL